MSHRALWLLPVAAAAVVVVLVVGLALGWDRSGNGTSHVTRPFAAATSLSSRTVSFGDPLVARLNVVVDPRSVDPASVEIQPSFGAYRIVSHTLERMSAGGERLAYRYVLECLDPVCVPGGDRVDQRFQPATVSYRTRAGDTVTHRVAWPRYLLSSRLTETERRRPEQNLRFDATLPPADYRVDPGLLRALLAVAAALLALVTAVLVGLALRPRAAADAAGPSESRLQQALRAVRMSTANGQPAARRKALGWLGRELRAVERPSEANEAGRLAWSADAPSAESAGDFATQVETSEDRE
jgi:hypothetical protein